MIAVLLDLRGAVETMNPDILTKKLYQENPLRWLGPYLKNRQQKLKQNKRLSNCF